jgi:serine protease Do
MKAMISCGILVLALAVWVPPSGEARGASAGAPNASDTADLVASLLPTVVSIESSRPRSSSGGDRTVSMNEPNFSRSLGSGFIIDPSGLIVTNKHVIEDASHVTVTLQNNATYRATLLGQGIETDIALLKIEALHPLPSVTFGDSDKIRPGDPVLAIGNPLGLGGSVSGGIVSALNRDIGDSPFGDFIQTDAAINHGNSGGPLFDSRGQVIGMNTAIISPTAGSAGLGFAIPANDVQFVVAQLRRYGRVHAGWIGVELQRLTPALLAAARLDQSATGVVVSVDPGGPAEAAGIQPGDIVISEAGKAPTDTRSFTLAIAAQEPGSTCRVVIWRDRRRIDLTVGVREWPATSRAGPMTVKTDTVDMNAPDFGLRLSPLTEVARERYKLSQTADGVTVTSIDPTSPAATTELFVGDIIREVQHVLVKTPADVMSTLSSTRASGNKYAMMLIEGPDGLRWISLPLGE